MGPNSKKKKKKSPWAKVLKSPPTSRSAIPLTRREEHLLGFLESEMHYSEIAARLGMRPNTIKSHMKSIFTKLGVRSRHGAVAWHLRRQLTPKGD